MPYDVFDQLAETEVPPIPADFDRSIHQRLNRVLLAIHLIDLGTRGILYAMTHFGSAVIGLLTLTFSGRYSTDRRDRSEGEKG